MNYSPQHLAAFSRYRDAGYSVKRLDEETLRALTEDTNFTDEVRSEFGRRWKQSDPPATRPASRAPKLGSMAKLNTETVAHAILDAIKTATAPLREKINALESRCIALEQGGPGVKWLGVYQHDKLYDEGSLTTLDGSLWLARHDTTMRPGKSDDWALIVKAGDYGRRPR
jgi:hypothetical protein